jgi:hypothetical protein
MVQKAQLFKTSGRKKTEAGSRLAVLGGVLLLAICLAPRAANAQNYPPGSYTSSCDPGSIHLDPSLTVLTATCNNGNGSSGTSSLSNVGECVGDISNNHATLECNRGSFRKSCQNINAPVRWVPGTYMITASCSDASDPPKWNPTQLSVSIPSQCNDVSNDNGQLSCHHQ